MMLKKHKADASADGDDSSPDLNSQDERPRLLQNDNLFEEVDMTRKSETDNELKEMIKAARKRLDGRFYIMEFTWARLKRGRSNIPALFAANLSVKHGDTVDVVVPGRKNQHLKWYSYSTFIGFCGPDMHDFIISNDIQVGDWALLQVTGQKVITFHIYHCKNPSFIADFCEEIEKYCDDSTKICKQGNHETPKQPSKTSRDLQQQGEDKVAGGSKNKVIDAVNEAYFEQVMELIAGNGNLENLSIPYYKAYLRKHGLRLSGTKGELLERIKQHLRLKRGDIEEYDKSTFKIECTDVVCGDVIMFKQKGHASHNRVTSSSWEALGDRMVAGRVIKEVYRGTKDQHMFTIEVFWSNGYQALDPLSMLQIKGCNLYQSRIYRQERESESCRPEMLEETIGSCIANRESRDEEQTMEIEGVELEANENECPEELVACEQPQETVVARTMYKKGIEQALTVSTTLNLKKVRKKKKNCSKNKCSMLASKSCPYVMCALCCSRQSCKRHANQAKQERENESCRPEMLEETSRSCIANRKSREREKYTMEIEGVEIKANEKECPQELVAYEQPQETVVERKRYKNRLEEALTVSTTSNLKKVRKEKQLIFCSKNKCPMPASKLCPFVMCALCCSRQSCERHAFQPKQGRENDSCRPEMLEETSGSCIARESREREKETMEIEGVEIEVNENECPQELVAYEQPQETVVERKSYKNRLEQALTVSTTSKLKKVREKKKFCSKSKCPKLASKFCPYAMCGLCCSRASCKRHANQPKWRIKTYVKYE